MSVGTNDLTALALEANATACAKLRSFCRALLDRAHFCLLPGSRCETSSAPSRQLHCRYAPGLDRKDSALLARHHSGLDQWRLHPIRLRSRETRLYRKTDRNPEP